MSVIFFPQDGGGFSSPVTIPVVFENTVEFDDTVVYAGPFTITGSLSIPGDLDVTGTASFGELQVSKDSTVSIPLTATDASSSITKAIAAGFFYENLTTDGRTVSYYQGLSETDCGKTTFYRNSSTDYHLRLYPNIDNNTYFYTKESGSFGFIYLGNTVLDFTTGTNSVFVLNSSSGQSIYQANSDADARFVANSTGTGSFIAFQGLIPNIRSNAPYAIDLGTATTKTFRMGYFRFGTANTFRMYLQTPVACFYDFSSLPVNGNSYIFGSKIPFSISFPGIRLLNDQGGTGDNTEPFLAGYTTYTPTVTQLKGTSSISITNLFSNWQRVANNVYINFQIRVEQGTVGSTEEQEYSISLPFTNTFSNNIQGAGCANFSGGVFGYGVCESYALNSAIILTMRTLAGSGASLLVGSFGYEVL